MKLTDHTTHTAYPQSARRLSLSATVHCLTGCSIGEILGMVIGTHLGWGNWPTMVLAIILAFVSGYSMTLLPLLRANLGLRTALWLALASDTLSVTVMEIIDNAVMLIIPGAMDAGLTEPLFWGSLIISLILAGIAAYPVNVWLITRGKGHARIHKHHGLNEPHQSPPGH